MYQIKIKPLSVNRAWQGRRFKTPEYKRYTKDVTLLLPDLINIPDGKLELHYIFYFSNSQSDYDNPIKPIQDIICTKYDINDNRIYKATIEKRLVKKGKERIEFYIKQLKEAP